MFVWVKLFLNVLLLWIVVLVRICLRIDLFLEMVIVIIGDCWEFCKWYVNLFWDWILRCFIFVGIYLEIGLWMVFD